MSAPLVRVAAGGSIAELNIQPSWNVTQLLEAILPLHRLDGPIQDYAVYHTNRDTWLDDIANPGAPLQQFYGFSTGDLLEVKYTRDVGVINLSTIPPSGKITDLQSLSKTTKPFKMDFTDPLNRIIPRAARVFVAKTKEDYCFRRLAVQDGKVQVLGFVNCNFSLKEYAVPPGSYLLLIRTAVFMERALSTLPNPAKEGWLTKNSKKGDNKATSVKKRWCILQDNFLFYYPDKKASSKPSGVIDLEYMQVEFDERTSSITINKVAQQSFKPQPLTYTFSPSQEMTDPSKEMKEWVRLLRSQSVNGAMEKCFGVDLSRVFLRTGAIPTIFTKSVQYLDQRGLQCEGIFRVPGSVSLIETLKDEFDSGKDVDLSKINDPYSVAGLLKLYLRDLPEPLLTFSLYEPFLTTIGPTVAPVTELVHSLPVANQMVLEILLNFMGRVAENKRSNKMDLGAISTVFAPNLLRPREQTQELMMRDSMRVQHAVELLIERRAEIFQNKAPPPRRSLSLKSVHYDTPPLQTYQQPQQQTFQEPPQISTPPQFAPPQKMAPPQLAPPVPPMDLPPPSPPVPMVRALYSYTASGKMNAKGETDLSFPKGALFPLVEERPNGWTKVSFNGKEGLVPSSYVEKVQVAAPAPVLPPVVTQLPPRVEQPQPQPQQLPPPVSLPPPAVLPQPVVAQPPPTKVAPPPNMVLPPRPVSVSIQPGQLPPQQLPPRPVSSIRVPPPVPGGTSQPPVQQPPPQQQQAGVPPSQQGGSPPIVRQPPGPPGQLPPRPLSVRIPPSPPQQAGQPPQQGPLPVKLPAAGPRPTNPNPAANVPPTPRRPNESPAASPPLVRPPLQPSPQAAVVLPPPVALPPPILESSLSLPEPDYTIPAVTDLPPSMDFNVDSLPPPIVEEPVAQEQYSYQPQANEYEQPPEQHLSYEAPPPQPEPKPVSPVVPRQAPAPAPVPQPRPTSASRPQPLAPRPTPTPPPQMGRGRGAPPPSKVAPAVPLVLPTLPNRAASNTASSGSGAAPSVPLANKNNNKFKIPGLDDEDDLGEIRAVGKLKKATSSVPREKPAGADQMINKLSSQLGVDKQLWMNFEKSVLAEIRTTVEEVDPIQWLLSMAEDDATGFGAPSTTVPTSYNANNYSTYQDNSSYNNNNAGLTPAEISLDDELAKLEAQIAAFDSGSFF